MTYLFNDYVYETFMDNFNNNICQNNGKRYTTDNGDKYVCGIGDLTEYCGAVIKMLKYNQQCKRDIQLEAKSIAFHVLKQNCKVPFALRSLVNEYLI